MNVYPQHNTTPHSTHHKVEYSSPKNIEENFSPPKYRSRKCPDPISKTVNILKVFHRKKRKSHENWKLSWKTPQLGNNGLYLEKYSSYENEKVMWCVKHPNIFILVTITSESIMTSYHANWNNVILKSKNTYGQLVDKVI